MLTWISVPGNTAGNGLRLLSLVVSTPWGLGGLFFFFLFFFGLLMCLGDSRPFVVQGGEGARGCWGAIKDPIRFFLGIPWVVSLRDGCGVALKPRGPTAARRTAIPPAVENQAGSRSLPWG